MKHLQQTTPIHRVVAFIAYCKTVFGSYSLCTLSGMALLLANSWYSAAQDWTKRHDFAKTYVGISNYFVPNNTQGYYLNQNGTTSTFNREGYMATAIVFGWDIRPSVRGDWWLLRTNLRYFPKLQLNYGRNALSFQHLEFNFIQFVWYPQKMKWHKKQAQREL